jgi:hypothetical protein
MSTFNLHEFLMKELAHPPKRQVKNKSGRAGRKLHNSRAAQRAVGGYADTMRAVYAPADTELCVVVDPESLNIVTTPGAVPPEYRTPQGVDRGYQGRVGCV